MQLFILSKQRGFKHNDVFQVEPYAFKEKMHNMCFLVRLQCPTM